MGAVFTSFQTRNINGEKSTGRSWQQIKSLPVKGIAKVSLKICQTMRRCNDVNHALIGVKRQKTDRRVIGCIPEPIRLICTRVPSFPYTTLCH